MSATIEEHLAWRCIEAPCPKCGGSGTCWYGSTSTWRGGAGGSAMTVAVCDVCWGSGDTEQRWTDLRALEAEHRDSRDKSTLDDLLRRLGGGRAEDVLALAEVLRKIDEGAARKGALGFWPRRLAGWLGEALATIAKSGPAEYGPEVRRG